MWLAAISRGRAAEEKQLNIGLTPVQCAVVRMGLPSSADAVELLFQSNQKMNEHLLGSLAMSSMFGYGPTPAHDLGLVVL